MRMVPPAVVLTNRKSRADCILALSLLCGLLAISGCAPPGPTALMRGKRALDEGRFPEAVQQLEKAATLLPKNALVWNYLGLAYHGHQQPEQAAKAYRTALALDHKISAIRYNLGCLYLEQNQLPPAIDEFRSYSLLQPAAVDGWVRLGSALLRARRLDEAERAYRSALELQARNLDALNGLGLIQMQRRRWQDALNHFNVAAVNDPPFPPAVLNSAIVAHQYLHQRGPALQRYRQYAALQPRPADAAAVEAIARSLEAELNPEASASRGRAASAPPVAHAAPRTNPTPSAAAAPATALNPSPIAVRASSSQPGNPTVTSSPPLTRTNVVSTRSAPVPASVNPTSTVAFSRPIESTRPATKTPQPNPKPPDLEVAQVAPDLVIKPAQDLAFAPKDPTTLTAPGTNMARAPLATDATTAAERSNTNKPKRGFFTRLNPFANNAKSLENSEPGTRGGATEAEVSSDSGRPVPRYNYLSPAAPTAGSRTEADKDFKRGLRAQKSGNRTQAITDYQSAVRNDPAYYDAYYNLGLAAFEQGDMPLSLWAYEIALALRPDSEDARYNFALALKGGGYWFDAVEELKRILAATPGSARAHLSIANLYSQQLHQVPQAREHYERVLELNPRHPEAPKIRYWLAANP